MMTNSWVKAQSALEPLDSTSTQAVVVVSIKTMLFTASNPVPTLSANIGAGHRVVTIM
jgi:hypothetical protein